MVNGKSGHSLVAVKDKLFAIGNGSDIHTSYFEVLLSATGSSLSRRCGIFVFKTLCQLEMESLYSNLIVRTSIFIVSRNRFWAQKSLFWLKIPENVQISIFLTWTALRGFFKKKTEYLLNLSTFKLLLKLCKLEVGSLVCHPDPFSLLLSVARYEPREQSADQIRTSESGF